MASPATMGSNPNFQPTLWEKLDLIPAHLSMVGAALYAAVEGPFRSDWGADTYRHHITHALVRKMVTRMNTAQIQYIAPAFQTSYQKYCKAQKIEPDIVTLKSGVKAFWVGQKTASNVCIYFHGGGYSLDGGEEHFNFWSTVKRDLAKANKTMSFLFVAYTLVPFGTYPTQFKEGAEALSYVLNDLGRSPSDVLLAGDSAGGNMCLALLSHLSHPSPDVSEIKIESKLKAIVVVAPWVSFKTDWPSMHRNRYKDLITAGAGAKWGKDYLGGRLTSPYAEALEAPESWWEGAKVEQLLCVAGSDEMLLDPITKWVEKYKSVNPDTTVYVVGKGEAHIAPIVEPRFGDSSETEQVSTSGLDFIRLHISVPSDVMGIAVGQNEITAKSEQPCVPPYLTLPSFAPLVMEDPGERRHETFGTSPLLPPCEPTSRRGGNATGAVFWPGNSRPCHRGTSSPAVAIIPTARSLIKNGQDSVLTTPTPGPSSVDSVPFKRNFRSSLLNGFSQKPSLDLLDEPNLPTGSPTNRHSSRETPNTNPDDSNQPAGGKYSQNIELPLSIRYEEISPVGSSSTLLESMVSRFEDSDEEHPTNGLHGERVSTGASSGLIDAEISLEDSYSNISSSSKNRTRTLLGLSSLGPRMESATIKRRSIRRGKRPARPTISRPILNNDNGSLNLEPKLNACRLRAAAHLQAFGHEQFLRINPPAPTSLIAPGGGSAESDADAVPARKRSLGLKVSRHGSQKMRLEHAGQRELVISEVMAVDRWGFPMRQYPIENGVRYFEGPVEHSDKLPAWMKRKLDRRSPREDLGAEQIEGKRKIPVGVGVGEEFIWGGKRTTWHEEMKTAFVKKVDRREGKRNVADMVSEESELRRYENEKTLQVRRGRSDLRQTGIGPVSGDIVELGGKEIESAVSRKTSSRQKTGEDKKDVMTTPKNREGKANVKVKQDSPNDSGYGEGTSSSTTSPNSRAVGEGKGHHSSPADSEYSQSKKSPMSSSCHFTGHEREERRQCIRQSIVQLREGFLAETDNRDKFLRKVARKENEISSSEKWHDHDKNVEDKLFAEQLQLQRLKEQHLSWWEKKSQPNVRTFTPVRRPKAIQDGSRWRSRIPLPIQQLKMDVDELTSEHSEHRLIGLKAATTQIFDHARKYEDCVMSLENVSFSPSITKQQTGPAWPVSGSSTSTRKGSQIAPSACWATAPGAAELGKGDDAPSSPEPFSLNGKPPPVPERSSRRVKFQLPLGENAIAGQSRVSSTETRQPSKPVPHLGQIEPYVMPQSVYEHWLALQEELKERFNIGDLSIVGELGVPVSPEERDTLTPEPLNLGCWTERRRAEQMRERLRYSISDYGDDFF